MITAETQLTPLEKSGMHNAGAECLVVIYAQEPHAFGKRYLLDGAALEIGRGVENDIVVESDIVSRNHCRIEKKSSQWFVADLKSTNGTYLNGRLVESQPLAPGDLIKVGETIFKYLSGQDVESQYHETIYRMTIIDGLTDLHNKRYLLEALDREVSRARRYHRPLSVILFDIDRFKYINDHFGHLAGDHVLVELAQVLRQMLRPDDIAGRYGGEEFLLILPETPLEEARTIAEVLRCSLAEQSQTFEGQTIRITVSLGVSQLQPTGEAVSLVKDADKKLYQAKNEGRNRVCS